MIINYSIGWTQILDFTASSGANGINKLYKKLMKSKSINMTFLIELKAALDYRDAVMMISNAIIFIAAIYDNIIICLIIDWIFVERRLIKNFNKKM